MAANLHLGNVWKCHYFPNHRVIEIVMFVKKNITNMSLETTSITFELAFLSGFLWGIACCRIASTEMNSRQAKVGA